MIKFIHILVLMNLRRHRNKSPHLNFVEIDISDVFDESFKDLIQSNNVVFIVKTNNKHGLAEQRRIFIELANIGIQNPIVISQGL